LVQLNFLSQIHIFHLYLTSGISRVKISQFSSIPVQLMYATKIFYHSLFVRGNQYEEQLHRTLNLSAC